MGTSATEAFRAKINASEELQDTIRARLGAGTLDLVALGKEQGFDFTQDEAKALIDQLEEEGELSEFELEVVSGGGSSSNDFGLGS